MYTYAMGIRAWLATFAIKSARGFGQKLGCELVVECSDHSLVATMELPSKGARAWDGNMYRRGQMYFRGYANPIKPTVDYHEDLRDPDTVDLEESEVQDTDEDTHKELISSPRYREYMRQDLISQLLNPREQWRLIAYAVIALALLMVGNLVVSLSAAGAI